MATPYKKDGGGDGNRTRVQKPLDMTFSVGSLSFENSPAGASANRLSFRVALLCLIGSRAKGRCKFTANMTLRLGSQYSRAERAVLNEPQHCH